jgi:ketosteroid isomerase-like protein
MKKHYVAACICFSTLVAGCQTTPTTDTADEAKKIMALESEWSNRFADGDIEWIMDLHASGAIQMPPSAPPVVGHEALRAQWKGMIQNLDASFMSTEAHVAASGDMAYDIGTVTINGPDGPIPAKYLIVWIREDGKWKVAVDMFSTNQP